MAEQTIYLEEFYYMFGDVETAKSVINLLTEQDYISQHTYYSYKVTA